MWFLKKKEEPIQTYEERPKECQHKWRDFDPIMKFSFYPYHENEDKNKKGQLKISMKESYVCCLCLDREDRTLCSWVFENLTQEEAYKKVQDFKKEYEGFYKPEAKIEDEILDMQYNIDREFLRNLALYHPEKVGSSFQSITRVPTLSEFKGDKNA